MPHRPTHLLFINILSCVYLLYESRLVYTSESSPNPIYSPVFYFNVTPKKPLNLLLYFWCRWPDSNRHSSRHHPLKMACLPIPPHRLKLYDEDLIYSAFGADSSTSGAASLPSDKSLTGASSGAFGAACTAPSSIAGISAGTSPVGALTD